MALSFKPSLCHGDCQGCYQHTIRAIKGPAENWPAMLATWKTQITEEKKQGCNTPTLHGGEPLMMPVAVLREALQNCYDVYGETVNGRWQGVTGMQTSLVGLTGEKLQLLTKYNCGIGVSIDGLDVRTNAGRLANLPAKARQARMNEVLHSLALVSEVGLRVSCIIMLRQCNKDQIIEVVEELADKYKIGSFRVNISTGGSDISPAEYADALCRVIDLQIRRPDIDLRPYHDFRNALVKGGKAAVCKFGDCDIWATNSDRAVLPDGSMGSCQHYSGQLGGIMPLRADKTSDERSVMLRQTPQECGGCQGCYYWPACHGGCPADGMSGDWRNRSVWCESYKAVWAYLQTLPIFDPTEKTGQVDSHQDSYSDRPHGDSDDPAWRAANPGWEKKVQS